jgi:hypothetical protein
MRFGRCDAARRDHTPDCSRRRRRDPAGTPHQMLLAPGERVVYVAIKVAAQPPPIAR